MIKRIENIRNFGIFRSFNWGSIEGIPDFKSKNIVYGWNYSGKTTLSRIFSSLRDKALSPENQHSSFRILTDLGNFESNNLTSFPYNLLVFNSDYIRDNLRWDYDNEINAIFFEVGENIKLEDRLQLLERKILEINGDNNYDGKRANFLKIIDAFDQFEASLFTDEARRIQNEHFISLIKFNKADLRKIKDEIIGDLTSCLVRDKKELNYLQRVIKIEEPKPSTELVALPAALGSLAEIENSINEILLEEPLKSDIVDILEKEGTKYRWVKEGMALNSPNGKCLFCDNTVTSERISLLNKYFENQASKLKQKAAKAIDDLKIQKEAIETINFPVSPNDLNEGFKVEYVSMRSQVDKILRGLSKHIRSLEEKLKSKLERSLYSRLDQINHFNLDNLRENIHKLNSLIENNNKFTSDFEVIIEKDRRSFIKHLVAKFLIENKYSLKAERAANARIQIGKLDDKVAVFTAEIKRLRAQKESNTEGCAQFNAFIRSFLSNEDIEIIVNPSSQGFNLTRGGHLAKNLSEGEKMAISFAHFLVTIRSIEKKGQFEKYIVFIDDPISSLDGNHVFQINSLLKETFFEQIDDPIQSHQRMWVLRCKQLFISTHNFEFFNLLKEMPTKRGFSYSSNDAKSKESRYFVSRGLKESQIERLPNVYDSYKSEYHYLFGEITSFNADPNKSTNPKLLLMPNILRRFLEMYTLTQFPSADELDDRADVVFGKRLSKRICKPFHFFSHFNNIDRIGKQSELISDISKACDDLLKFLNEKNDQHIKALRKAIV